MDMSLAKDVINFIRAERDKRFVHLEKEDPEFGYNVWPGSDEIFINELCLMLLVATRHQVERELLGFAARVSSDRRELGAKEYGQKVQEEREQLRQNGWKTVVSKLQLTTFSDWSTTMETLRLLANSYKHHPSMAPDEALLKHLGLDPRYTYAPLPESPTLREGLAVSLSLKGDSDYCDIADKFMKRASRFLSDVQAKSMLAPINKWEVASPMNPRSFIG